MQMEELYTGIKNICKGFSNFIGYHYDVKYFDLIKFFSLSENNLCSLFIMKLNELMWQQYVHLY